MAVLVLMSLTTDEGAGGFGCCLYLGGKPGRQTRFTVFWTGSPGAVKPGKSVKRMALGAIRGKSVPLIKTGKPDWGASVVAPLEGGRDAFPAGSV